MPYNKKPLGGLGAVNLDAPDTTSEEHPTLGDQLRHLEQLDDGAPFNRLLQRLGLSADDTLLQRWVLIGAFLALEQPEFGLPKRKPGRPAGTTKPLDARAPAERAALDEYERKIASGVSIHDRNALAGAFQAIREVIIERRLTPKNYDLKGLIVALGGIPVVSKLIKTPTAQLRRLIKVEQELIAERAKKATAWKAAREQVKATATASAKGDPKAAAVKALGRLAKDRSHRRLVEALMGRTVSLR